MLKGIDPLVGPDLLRALARMGHGDRLALVDRNYPAYSSGRPVYRIDGAGIIGVASAILELFPLDTCVDCPAERMQVSGTPETVTAVQREFMDLLSSNAKRNVEVSASPRHEFYQHVREAFAIVSTGESQPYSCFIISKGTVPEIFA
jgi:L-fucose mutarotase